MSISPAQIRCPHCGKSFELSEAVTGELRSHLEEELDREFAERNRRVAQLEKSLAGDRKALEASREELETRVAERVKAEAARLENAASEKAKEAVAVQLKDLQGALEEKTKSIEDARAQELALRKQARELEEKQKSLELDLQRRLDEETEAVRRKALEQFEEERRLKDKEKDKVIDGLRKSLEEARRKAEQGSMETQGEVLELDLEQTLSAAFPGDRMEPVPKGIRGADLLQHVLDSQGRDCGVLLWETKNTKNWTDGWIPKLKDDLVAVRGRIAILVSRVLPDGIERFGQRDGVWISDTRSAIGLASALREQLIAIAFERVASVGKNEKMDALYHYLSGGEFRQKVETIVETFTSMHAQLAREKRAMEKLWKEREKQIERVALNTAGMYGDIRGIAGASLPEIRALELDGDTPQLPEPEET